jgi:hypothetical protein
VRRKFFRINCGTGIEKGVEEFFVERARAEFVVEGT